MLKPSIEEFMREARLFALERHVIAIRARRPNEDKSFEAYVAMPAEWNGENRLVLILLTSGGNLVVAVAPPTASPLCVSRGADSPLEARAVDEALYELGSRYTSWCRVFFPPAFEPRTLREIPEILVELGIVDAVG
ncbi:hypothetical protein Pyrfu_1322 [Pyrolobus fumarii 1A]|uniref:Uncharacterized protein n=1 Tax=Pyrolobus fumarii (strain DSM 11204 / 1A) TaxID=694429 RepID=G0EGF6_PYRF1|nr:hypothetical protein [Pyrolobus fumarii]AEM39181.1 hypothetical protein Pyrfu_1322 [Pyrolobus fumarii 1A]